MKSSRLQLSVVFVLLLALPAGLPSSLGAEAAAAAPGAPSREPPPPSSAAVVRLAYLALVKDSIVPAQPRVIATAALDTVASIVPEQVPALPAWFGANPERDAAWLMERVTNLQPAWPVIDAMVRSADTAHVGFRSPERSQGFAALGRGEPLSSPGFNLYPLADGRFVVFDLVNGASAHASGLRAGDVLLRLDGKRAVVADVFLLHALPAGTEVTLAIERANRSETITLRLKQAEVSPVESRRLDDGTGYIFIRRFSRSTNPARDTAALVRRAIAEFAAQDARAVIVDLRSTLGGVGEVAIASACCDADVIYSIQKPLSAPAQPTKRQGERLWPDRPIVVLVNQHTVSAPEGLALALRELTHATIIGQTTRGGLTEFSGVPLAPGYTMTIPTGAVRGPLTGTTPHGYAIVPDLVVANPGIDDLLRGRDGQLDAARAALPRISTVR
ncbi:MAG TPA: S41 family peptidase [Opitutaceae bacterium]|nr:S41 family peptidase [Opitutaceae bacterium]